MICIKRPKDITSAIPCSSQAYLRNYLQSIMAAYSCKDIRRYGSIYYLNQKNDLSKYLQMGLIKPLHETTFEYCEVVVMKNSYEKIKLFHGCFLCNNDFAVDIFADIGLLGKELTDTLLQNN